MKVVFVVKLAIAFTITRIISLVLPNSGMVVTPLTWILIGNWWRLLFLFDWIITLAQAPWLVSIAQETALGIPKFMTVLEGWLDFTPTSADYGVFIGPLFQSGLSTLLVLVVMMYAVERIALWRFGPFLERKAEAVLGYKPRKL